MGKSYGVLVELEVDRRRQIASLVMVTAFAASVSYAVLSQSDLARTLLLVFFEATISVPLYVVLLLFYNRRILESWKHVAGLLALFGVLVSVSLGLVLRNCLSIAEWFVSISYGVLVLSVYDAVIFPVVLIHTASFVRPRPRVFIPDFKSVKTGVSYDYTVDWLRWFRECTSRLNTYRTWSYMAEIVDVFVKRIEGLFEKEVSQPGQPQTKIPLAAFAIENLINSKVTDWDEPGWQVGFLGFREALSIETFNEKDYKRILESLRKLATLVRTKSRQYPHGRDQYMRFARQIDDFVVDLRVYSDRKQKQSF